MVLAVDMVVDGLLDGLAALELLELLEHQIEVIFREVEGGALRDLPSFAVIYKVRRGWISSHLRAKFTLDDR